MKKFYENVLLFSGCGIRTQYLSVTSRLPQPLDHHLGQFIFSYLIVEDEEIEPEMKVFVDLFGYKVTRKRQLPETNCVGFGRSGLTGYQRA